MATYQIGGGEEAFQLRGSAVAEMSMGDWEKTSWPESRMHIARSWESGWLI